MNRYLLLPLVLGAVACEAPLAPYSGDVLWIQIIDQGTVCPDVAITHNYNAYLSDTTSVFDVTTESTESTGGEYIYVTRGEDGSIFVNLRGEVLTGIEKDNGSIEVTWTNEETSSQLISEDTWQSSVSRARTVEQTMTLRPNDDETNPVYGGAYTRRDFRQVDLVETDEWDLDVVSIGTQLGETENYLTWFEDPPGQGNSNVRNYSYLDDCLTADDCEFHLLEDCTRQYTVEGVKLDGADIETFDAISGFDQPNGVE